MLCLTVLFATTFSFGADMGNFAGDYDYGGGNDYDDYDYGGNDYDYGGNDNYDYSNSDSSDEGGWSTYVAVAVIFVITLAIIIPMTSGKKKKKPHISIPTNAPKAQLIPISQYNKLDPNFSAADMSQKLSNLYVQMQNCWQDKNMESLRPYFTDALYSQFDRQLDTFRRNNQTNYVERIAVLGVNLKGYYQGGGEDHIIAEVKARIVDYTLDDKTGKLLSGNKTAEKFMTYEWELVRPSGTLTQNEEQVQNIHCPNCGAPLKINQSARCPYCDSVVTVSKHQFVISSIRGISQQTGR